MDFGFVPRKDKYLGYLRRMVKLRPNTKLIHDPKHLHTLQDFLKHLETSSHVSRPIQDIVLGSHAFRMGKLDVQLFKKAWWDTEYEMLEASLADPANSIAIPDSLIDWSATGPTRFFYIKGCNIGKAKPFLVKLKEALGKHVCVTAPKHFHGLTPNTKGVFEWMAYEFVFFQKTKVASRSDLIAGFQSGPWTLIDGSPVSTDQWEKWMKGSITTIAKTNGKPVFAKLGKSLGKLKTVETGISLRVDKPSITQPLVPYAVPYGATTMPSTKSARLADMKTKLQAEAVNASNHPFPWFARLGYATFQEMFNGMDWTPSVDTKANTINWAGDRFEYTLVVPIMDVSTDLDPRKGNIVFNFYPDAGSGSPLFTQGFAEGDPEFFEMV